MRLGTFSAALAILAALGCDGGDSETDGGGQPEIDGGPVADGGRGDGGRDGGTGADPDSGGTTPDGGAETCSTGLPSLGYEEIASGEWGGRLPVGLAQPPGEDEDLYVIDQPGEIVIVRGGAVLGDPFLEVDVDYRSDHPERGLLGLAFHPDYATNGRFFVYYTATEGGTMRNIVAEYHASGGVADPSSETRLVDIEDPEDNHNGGMIAFGQDGFLYVAIGDGGGAGDRHGPNGNGQNLNTLLGKILRLDVDNESGAYAAEGNPFGAATDPAGLPQIWAYGLRNPWRFSFDRLTGDLWIGDVGQNQFEEIDFQPASSAGGENYGWVRYEGFEVFDDSVPEPDEHTPPVLVYHHSGDDGVIGGRAVTGGYVYRGSAIPDLRGWYLFGDYTGTDLNQTPIAALRRCDGAISDVQQVPALSGALGILTSFGEDNQGELYMIGERVLKIVAE